MRGIMGRPYLQYIKNSVFGRKGGGWGRTRKKHDSIVKSLIVHDETNTMQVPFCIGSWNVTIEDRKVLNHVYSVNLQETG